MLSPRTTEADRRQMRGMPPAARAPAHRAVVVPLLRGVPMTTPITATAPKWLLDVLNARDALATALAATETVIRSRGGQPSTDGAWRATLLAHAAAVKMRRTYLTLREELPPGSMLRADGGDPADHWQRDDAPPTTARAT